MFTKEERSSFPYWFAHWCAFQMTALVHRMWRAKYLFHDCEKPWLRLLFPYEKVQKWHRQYHNHHLEWLENEFDKWPGEPDIALSRFDFEGMVIDWECSRFTKEASPLNAREQLQEFNKLKYGSKYPNCICHYWDKIMEKCNEVMNKYGF